MPREERKLAPLFLAKRAVAPSTGGGQAERAVATGWRVDGRGPGVACHRHRRSSAPPPPPPHRIETDPSLCQALVAMKGGLAIRSGGDGLMQTHLWLPVVLHSCSLLVTQVATDGNTASGLVLPVSNQNKNKSMLIHSCPYFAPNREWRAGVPRVAGDLAST